jgi:hypothetical protein
MYHCVGGMRRRDLFLSLLCSVAVAAEGLPDACAATLHNTTLGASERCEQVRPHSQVTCRSLPGNVRLVMDK